MGTTTTKRKLNMETEIEELRETLYEAGELMQKLKVFSSAKLVEERDEMLAKIKALLPEPEPFEAWGNFYGGFFPVLYRTLERAKTNAGPGTTREAVHLREVTPAAEWTTAQEWTKWKEVGRGVQVPGNLLNVICANEVEAAYVAAYHNAEMERVTGTEGK
jgi:hypothetical protein